MKDEKSIIKEKENRIRELESALSSMTLQCLCQKNYIDVVNEGLGEEEKNFTLEAISVMYKKLLNLIYSNGYAMTENQLTVISGLRSLLFSCEKSKKRSTISGHHITNNPIGITRFAPIP